MEKLPHLNTQTNSNLSFSFLKINDLIKLAKEKNLNYLSISDYYPYEIISFFEACKKNKIKAIWGIKIFFHIIKGGNKYSVTIYPKNNRGYKDVLKKLFSLESPKDRSFFINYVLNLSENCFLVFEANDRIEIDYFSKKIIFVDKKNDEVNYENLFIGFNFYLFSPNNDIDSKVILILLPFFNIKCLNKAEIKFINILKKTSLRENFFNQDFVEGLNYELDDDILFPLLTNDFSFYRVIKLQLIKFIEKINISIKKISKKNVNNLDLLESKCLRKLLFLKKDSNELYKKTLEKEISLIKDLDYIDYFLTFSEIVKYLKEKNNIIGPGRGSSVSSLVAYLLEITSIDPLEHGLFFERFLNKKRDVMPDIDLDVIDRDIVIDYLKKRYSNNKIAYFFNRKKIGLKKAFEISSSFFQVKNKLEIFFYLKENKIDFEKIKDLDSRYPNFLTFIEKIKDLYYDTTINQSGVIISKNNLSGIIPLRLEDDKVFSLFESECVDKLKIRRYDFLNLKDSLLIIKEAKKNFNLPEYDEINLKDEKTWYLLNNFLISGIFQLDTQLLRKLFFKFNPNNFRDLVIFISLNRPGSNKKIKELLREKNLKIKRKFSSLKISEILFETYNCLIFEEQISSIFSIIYDCSFSDSEIKRRELNKKKLGKDFLIEAQKKLTSYESEFILNQINSSISFIFNKSHAVAYAYLTFYISYLKANYFDKLIIYFLNNSNNSSEKTLEYLRESFFFGFEIKIPDINYSEINWINNKKVLIMGFSSLKNYDYSFFSKIIQEREKGIFKDFEELIKRTFIFWENIKEETIKNWINSGLFNSLSIEIDTLIYYNKQIYKYLKIKNLLKKTNDLYDINFSKNFNLDKSLINQREFDNIGIYINYFSEWNYIIKNTNYKISNLLEIIKNNKEEEKKIIIIYSILTKIERLENFYYLSLHDIRNSFRIPINYQLYEKKRKILLVHKSLLFTLELNISGRNIIDLNCKEIEEL